MAKIRSASRIPALTVFILLCAGSAAMAQEQEGAAPAQEGAAAPAAQSAYAEAGACATCHEELATALQATTHGRTSRADWDGGRLCETCHGPGAAHVEGGGDKAKIRRPTALPAQEQSAICLSCHEKEGRAYWQGSPHDGRDLSCLTCHKIHHTGAAPDKLLAKKTEFATCTSCHLRRKASLVRSAHMPMREGQMTCSSCHNPHGSPGPALLLQNSLNENCYSCHAEKRSPMLWEHPPVKENCANCHDPHGSLHPRMQVMKQPRVCQQCHDEMRHPTQPYSDASSAPEFFPNSRMFDRGCMNCHSMIHGSNHPAGMRFLR
jgi:DmsE family decaheme c-type cytochrome